MIFMRGRWQVAEKRDRDKATYSVVGGSSSVYSGSLAKSSI